MLEHTARVPTGVRPVVTVVPFVEGERSAAGRRNRPRRGDGVVVHPRCPPAPPDRAADMHGVPATESVRQGTAARVADADDQDVVEHDPYAPEKPRPLGPLSIPARDGMPIMHPNQSRASRQSKLMVREKIMLDIAFIYVKKMPFGIDCFFTRRRSGSSLIC